GALAATDPLTAVRLCELALATEPAHRGALAAYRDAHERLLAEHDHANFWLTRWLEGEVRSATNRLARLDPKGPARPGTTTAAPPAWPTGSARRATTSRPSTSRSTPSNSWPRRATAPGATTSATSASARGSTRCSPPSRLTRGSGRSAGSRCSSELCGS